MRKTLIGFIATLVALILGISFLAAARVHAAPKANSARAAAGHTSTAAPVHVGAGGGAVYKIYGFASGCDTKGTKEDQTVDLHLDTDGSLNGDMAAGSIAAFGDFYSMRGVLRTDGSFTMTTDGGRGASTWNGQLDNHGNITGTWDVTSPDTGCHMRVAPLSSWLYFGVTVSSWRTEFGVAS